MNKYKYIFVTCNFPSKNAAYRYYNSISGENTSYDDITTKIKENSIAIGRPEPRKDEDVWLSHSEERYFIGVK